MMKSASLPGIRAALSGHIAARDLKDRSRKTLESTVNSMCRHAGGFDLPVAEITADWLNGWLAAMTSGERTKIKHRGNALTLLRAAADAGWCPEPVARKVRKPRRPKPKPSAWSLDQLRRIRDAADDLDGVIRRHGTAVPACIYWGCLIRLAYETGLRRGNLFALRQSDVTDAGLIYVRHEKTGEPHLCSLSPHTLALLRRLPGECPLRWADSRSFYRRWRRICTAAGVPYGALHRCRKTAATQVWLEDQSNPTRVQQFLGHLTPEMWRHYVDRSQGGDRPPQPPELD